MYKKTSGISRVFLRFFLSFSAVLLIPLLILGTISRKTIRNIMEKSELQKKTAAINQCAENVGIELDNIRTIVFKASVDQDFSPFIMTDFTQNSLSVINRLQNFKTANNFIHEIYLASPYSDYIFSTGTTYSYERFIRQKMSPQTSRGNLFAVLSNACRQTQFGYMPSAETGSFFLVYSLPIHTAGSYAYMIFEIPKAILRDYFNTALNSDTDSMMILDGNVLIASYDDYSGQKQQRIIEGTAEAAKNRMNGFLKPEQDSSPLFFLKDKSTGLTYVFSLSESEATAAVNQVVSLFTFCLILLLLVGAIAIYILTEINYSPIKKLANSASGLFDSLQKNKRTDEINFLNIFIRKSRASYQKMNLELEDSLIAAKYYFIKNLVNGYPYSPDALKDMLLRTSMAFYGTHFFTVIFHNHSREPFADTAGLTDFISAFSPEDISGYAANLYGNHIVGIYSCRHDDMDKIKVQMENLRRESGNHFHIMLTAGMGGLKDGLPKTAASFLEASTALDFRLLAGKNKLICFSEIKISSCPEINYSRESIDSVCHSIKTGSKETLIHTLKELFSSIRQNTCSMYTARLLCYDVTNSILKTLREIADSNAGFRMPNLIALTNYETVEDLEQVLRRFCETACDYVCTLKPPTISEKAISYISKNFAGPDFSVSSISNHLGISSSYLSHLFKEQQEITITDYIKLYKLALAKKMLTETDNSLEKIIPLLGFYDCSSFIRMFKQMEGMTPGEYRKRK